MRTLPEALTGILLTALAACAADPPAVRPVVGGTPYAGPLPAPTSGTATVSCADDGNMRKLYARLRWSPEVESVALYAMPASYPGGPAVAPGTRPVLRHMGGAPCKNDACEAEREAVAQTFTAGGQGWVYADEMFADGYYPTAHGFAVVRRGGKQVLVTTLEGLRTHLARITTADEAQAWAAIHRIGATCTGGGPNVAAGEDWHELRAEYTTCVATPGGPSQMARMAVTHRVYADGRIESGTPKELGRTPTHESCATPGRVPLGGLGLAPSHDDSFGALLARLAHAEAASVTAFRELATTLAAEGAPASLVARAREAGRDEARHAAVMGAHARAHGGELQGPVEPEGRYPSLLAVALHNAREGCVNEAYAALVTMHQVRFADDAALRRDLRSIADDELRHAEWSRDLDDWLQERLTDADRRAVAAEKGGALAKLERSAVAKATEAARRAGMPEPRVAAHLVAGLRSLVATPS
jgi:hypothetical protein